MNKVILKIEGMSCSACQAALEKYLNKQAGIISASVNLVLAQALIQYEDNLTIDDLNSFVSKAGYKSLGIYNELEEQKNDKNKNYLIVFAFLVIILMYISMGHMINLPVIPICHMKDYPISYATALLILTIPFLIFGFDIIKSGIKKLFYRSPNMDSLVMIGVLSSTIYSLINFVLIIKGNSMLVEHLYFESTAMIIYFVKLGRYIDRKSKEKTKEAIKELVQITPNYALLKTKDGEKQVTIDEVKKGDILICKPGMKIAVDGVITLGETHLDEAFITGESVNIKKKTSDKVIAGSINIDGYIEYKAEKIGKDSTISEIVRLVVEASNTKAPIQKLADIVSSYFVSGIIFIAIVTLVMYLILGLPFNDAIISFVTILVVACPCALGLATPLAVVISEGKAAKQGILIKTSEAIENANKIDTVIFDKTGTLTYGKPKISQINNYSKYSDKDLIRIVASLESNSTHPIATAFKNYIAENKMKLEKIEKFNNIAGIGIDGEINKKRIYIGSNKLLTKLAIPNKYNQIENKLAEEGNSIVYVVEEKSVIALLGVKDVIRKNVKETIKNLKNMNIKVIMLSGDNEKTANTVAASLGIKKVIANCLPQDKEKYIKELKKTKNMIMMVGDGINDAPSLAIADIGVSINSGTDIAADSSDVILMNDDLSNIISLLTISKRTIKIIKQNLFWAFFYNICMIPIAIGILKPLGISITPMFASFAMTISSLTVAFNSLRLKK